MKLASIGGAILSTHQPQRVPLFQAHVRLGDRTRGACVREGFTCFFIELDSLIGGGGACKVRSGRVLRM